MNRVEELADRNETQARALNRIPYKSLVPLPEIIGDTLGVGVASKAVKKEYDNLIHQLGNEFSILMDATLEDIKKVSSKHIAEAIHRVRTGNIHIEPGYDGIFGVVKVFEEKDHRGVITQVGLEFE